MHGRAGWLHNKSICRDAVVALSSTGKAVTIQLFTGLWHVHLTDNIHSVPVEVTPEF